jgi:hypothetical protein
LIVSTFRSALTEVKVGAAVITEGGDILLGKRRRAPAFSEGNSLSLGTALDENPHHACRRVIL